MQKSASRDIDRAHDRSSSDMATLSDVLFILGNEIEVDSRVERGFPSVTSPWFQEA